LRSRRERRDGATSGRGLAAATAAAAVGGGGEKEEEEQGSSVFPKGIAFVVAPSSSAFSAEQFTSFLSLAATLVLPARAWSSMASL
jgi:hypothetical protein